MYQIMRTNILWTGKQHYSLENCLVSETKKAIGVNSVIIGTADDNIFRTEYFIKTNKNWEINFLAVNHDLNGKTRSLRLQHDINGHWKMNGKAAKRFSDCRDIDISLTPFTNTLPINRLNFTEKKEQTIDVIYLDILEWKIKRVKQSYTRLSNNIFKYENVPNNFEASIKVDKKGLVVDYPGLFSRTAIQEVDFRINHRAISTKFHKPL